MKEETGLDSKIEERPAKEKAIRLNRIPAVSDPRVQLVHRRVKIRGTFRVAAWTVTIRYGSSLKQKRE